MLIRDEQRQQQQQQNMCLMSTNKIEANKKIVLNVGNTTLLYYTHKEDIEPV